MKNTSQAGQGTASQVEGLGQLRESEVQEEIRENEAQEQGHISSEEEEELHMDQPLPPIDPEEENTATQVYKHDTIIVQLPPGQENTIREQENGGPIGLDVAGRPQRTRPIREIFRPAAWQAFMAGAAEPATLQEALVGKDDLAWKAAWESELESLQKNGTWVNEKAAKDRNIVGCRWLFRRKEDGRFKVH